jgi:hypothetical protein
MNNLINGPLKAVTVVTNCWEQSCRFYRDALGYNLLAEGELSAAQKAIFGPKLGRYTLWGYETGSVVRLLELNDPQARPIREGARAYDTGMAVIEGGTPDVMQAYFRVLRCRFGSISAPKNFYVEGPEPLGKVLMKSAAFMGPAGEQVFVTEITQREGGVSLLKEKSVEGINAPGNVAFCMVDRQPIENFWGALVGLRPVNDLPVRDPNAPEIMGGPEGMTFDMLLMGFGMERIGMEFHIYGPYQPDYDYRRYPTSFDKTGLASATWPTPNLKTAIETFKAAKIEILSEFGLPTREKAEPAAVVVRGPLGEIVELI